MEKAWLRGQYYDQRYSRLVECMTAVKSAYPQAYAFDPFFKIAKQLVLAADSGDESQMELLVQRMTKVLPAAMTLFLWKVQGSDQRARGLLGSSRECFLTDA